MTVGLENKYIPDIVNLLFGLSLKGKESRHRSRLIKGLQEHLNILQEEEHQILLDHAELDEKGNPKKKENGTKWDIKDLDAFASEKSELMNEVFYIDNANLEESLNIIYEVLNDSDEIWEGKEAMIYDYFLSEIEKIKTEGEENE